MIDIDKVLKLADELGIDYEFVDEGDGGFFITQPDGSERRLTDDDIINLLLGNFQ